jgi:hypothetical protein
MGRLSEHCRLRGPRLEPTAPSTSLAESLLGASIVKRRGTLTVSFDDRRDADCAHRHLVDLQETYQAPRK